MSLTVELDDEAATARLGADIAHALRPGDVVALSGEIGAGKTTLARALLRTLHRDTSMDVASPTFTLAIEYPDARIPAVHADLYRLADPAEADELGLEEAAERGVVLVEWPEWGDLEHVTLSVELAEANDGDTRIATMRGAPDCLGRVSRSLAIRQFLKAAGHDPDQRRPLGADVSARGYDLLGPDGTALLMDSPPMKVGPPVRNARPYCRIAHQAETIGPFVAIGRALRERGFHSPKIEAVDLDHGLAVIENMGSGTIVSSHGEPIRERYLAVARTLAALHDMTWPSALPIGDGTEHSVPAFDRAAMLIEVEQTVEWAFPRLVGRKARPDEREAFFDAWNLAFDRLDPAERSLVLRDVQAPNIVWREDAEGHDRVGLIDFQDALIGPAAYDIASLAQDARVSIPIELEREIVSAYLSLRATRDPHFDMAYAVMAAQRATKVFGLWVRLDERDGKPHYLAHAPRTREYISRVLPHPALNEVREWFEAHELLPRSEVLAVAA